jgi:hypothetical protein
VGCRDARRRIVKLADLSTVVIRRRLPLRVEGSQGEAIDYWLDATAIGVDITVGALARAADLPIATLGHLDDELLVASGDAVERGLLGRPADDVVKQSPAAC